MLEANGLDPKRVSDWKVNGIPGSVAFAVELARTLQCSVEQLVYGADQAGSPQLQQLVETLLRSSVNDVRRLKHLARLTGPLVPQDRKGRTLEP